MNPTNPVRLGISTCPNDTFAFHALLNQRIDCESLDFQIDLLDIQELNQRLTAGQFDVAKASFHAALHLSDSTVVLPSGSALGYGVGPLLLAAKPNTSPGNRQQLTLCPGRDTTAALLFELFHHETTRVEHCVFSEIMPRLQNESADFGVCIHEGRFTWQQHGLGCVEDLGTRWESETHCPLPLGGLLAGRHLPEATIAKIQSVIRRSLEYALANPDDALPTMRRYAQEFDDDVLRKHVELYVNDWTLDLGPVGADALNALSEMAKSAGIVPPDHPGITVWQP